LLTHDSCIDGLPDLKGKANNFNRNKKESIYNERPKTAQKHKKSLHKPAMHMIQTFKGWDTPKK
jgi:hypothetical protein